MTLDEWVETNDFRSFREAIKIHMKVWDCTEVDGLARLVMISLRDCLGETPRRDIGITKQDVELFLKTFDRLAEFEGQTRQLRGYGAFSAAELPEIQRACKSITQALKKQ